MLSQEEHKRYDRHLLLKEVGKQGQEKLKNSRVLVIGAGGLGCPILQYLAAAGVGNIGVIDFDIVEESNLQRQILFGESSLGINKAIAAKKRLEDLNSFINIKAYTEKLGTENALELFQEYDIIVDGTDNFSTRYLVNDACVITGKSLVYGAIFRFSGQVSVFNCDNGPSYRCLFPEPPEAGSVPGCSEAGVIGVLPGIIGTQQANEVIKLILGIGKPLIGRLQIYDALSGSTSELKIKRNEAEIQKVVDAKDQFKTMNYDLLCGVESKAENIREISAMDLHDINDSDYQLIDVREPFELEIHSVGKAINIPLNEITDNIQKINTEKKVIFMCKSGIRSKKAIADILEIKRFDNLYSLKDGVSSLL